MAIFRKIESKSFRLSINPAVLTTAQQKGVRIVKSKSGRCFPSFFKKQKAVQNERMIKGALKPFVPQEAVHNDGDTAVLLEIVYMFPYQSGAPKWKREGITFMTQRPDADNLSKAFVDCMTDMGFWEDDSIVNFRFSKFRFSHPRIDISYEIWRQEKEQLGKCCQTLKDKDKDKDKDNNTVSTGD